MPVMPPPIFSSTFRNFSMDNLVHEFHSDERAASGRWHPGDWLLGYVLSPFQRSVVWDDVMMARFVESAWDGFHLGTFVVNNAMDEPWPQRKGEPCFHPTDRWLIDGQQRLTAIDRYLRDAFPIKGSVWSELDMRGKRRFERIPFAASEVRMTDETALRVLRPDELRRRSAPGGGSRLARGRLQRLDVSGPWEVAPIPRERHFGRPRLRKLVTLCVTSTVSVELRCPCSRPRSSGQETVRLPDGSVAWGNKSVRLQPSTVTLPTPSALMA